MIARVLTTTAVLGALIPATAPTQQTTRQTDQQTQRYTLAGSRVAVYNLAGEVQVVAGTGSSVVVEVTRGGADSRELEIESGMLRGRESLRIVYPWADIVYPQMGRGSNTEFRVREDGTFGDDDNEGWRGSRRDRIRIQGSGRGAEAYADLRILVPEGRDVSVYLGVGDATVSNVNGHIRIDGSSVTVNATDVRGSLEIDLGSGTATVNGVEGDLLIDTGSGSVDVTRVNGQTILIDTGSGSILGTDLTAADNLKVDTGSGRVRLSAVSSPSILIDTGSGSVELGLTTDVESLVIDTGSGGVNVSFPAGIGASIEVDTGSGGIDTDFPIQVTRWERDHLTGKIGDGRGQITIDTGSGSVTLRKS